MSSRLQPLLTLLEQAERERDLAVGEELRARQALKAALQQAERLSVYRQEYEQRWGGQFRQASAIEVVRCYQEFMGRLQRAVDQQQQQIALATVKLESARTALRRHEMRVAPVRKLIENRRREAARENDRREQRASDELAARNASRSGVMRCRMQSGGVMPA